MGFKSENGASYRGWAVKIYFLYVAFNFFNAKNIKAVINYSHETKQKFKYFVKLFIKSKASKQKKRSKRKKKKVCKQTDTEINL